MLTIENLPSDNIHITFNHKSIRPVLLVALTDLGISSKTLKFVSVEFIIING